MKAHLGYTNIDIIVSVTVILVAGLVIALAGNPWASYERAQDKVLADGVRDYLEAFMELQADSPERFWELTYQGASAQTSIGSCATCVDVSAILVPMYLSELPVDWSGGYSLEDSGYYCL